MSAWPDGLTNGRTATSWESLLARGVNCNDPAYLGDVQDACDAADNEDGLVFIPEGTFVGNVTIPDGTTIWGAGRTRTIIQGKFIIGSDCVIRDLQFGAVGSRTTFSTGADNCLIENCAIVGGDAAAAVYFNDTYVTNVTFRDCSISGNVSNGNGVQIVDKGTLLKHYENITFERCYFHSNDRMNFECIQREDVGNPVVQGYRNINLIDCVLEKDAGAAGSEINVSYDAGMLADLSALSSGYSTIRGCRITGGVYGIELAGSRSMLIEGNSVSSTTSDLMSMSQFLVTDVAATQIINNRFEGAHNVVLAGSENVWADNRVDTSGSLRLAGCASSTLTGGIVKTSGATAVSVENSPYNTFVGMQIKGGSNQSFLFIYVGTDNNLVDDCYIDYLNAIFDVRDSTVQHFGKNLIISAADAVLEYGRDFRVRQLTYSASMTPDARFYSWQKITVTNGTAMTMNAPTAFGIPGERLTFDFLNSSGGAMGAITWATGTEYKLAGAFTNPANTKRRTIQFYYDGTSWIEMNRAAADI